MCSAARNRNQLLRLDQIQVNFYPVISSGSTSPKLLVQWFQETLSILGAFCLVQKPPSIGGSYSHGQFLFAIWQVQVQPAVCISEHRKKEGTSSSGDHTFHKSNPCSEAFIRPSCLSDRLHIAAREAGKSVFYSWSRVAWDKIWVLYKRKIGRIDIGMAISSDLGFNQKHFSLIRRVN